MRVSLDELMSLERAGSVRWIEPKDFSLARNRLPKAQFVLEFASLAGRIYICEVTQVGRDAVQLSCPAENIAGIWFADMAARMDAARKPAKRSGTTRGKNNPL